MKSDWSFVVSPAPFGNHIYTGRATIRVRDFAMSVDVSAPAHLDRLVHLCTVVDAAVASATVSSAASRQALTLISQWTSTSQLDAIADCDAARVKGPDNKVAWPWPQALAFF